MNVVGYYQLSQALAYSPQLPEPIGVLQSGVVGYFSGRRFVALDGKVNHQAAQALRSGELYPYLQQQQVQVVDAYPWMVELVLQHAQGPAPSTQQITLRDGERELGGGVILEWAADSADAPDLPPSASPEQPPPARSEDP